MRIDGLKSAAASQYNGTFGVCEIYHADTGRWDVLCELDGESRGLKPENITGVDKEGVPIPTV